MSRTPETIDSSQAKAFKLGDKMPKLYKMLIAIKNGMVSFPGPKKQASATMVHIVYCEAKEDLSAIDAAHAEELDRVRRETDNLRATIDRQAAKMQAREASYMDALAAKSIRIDELATLIESLQTEIARLRAGAMPEEVRETLLDGLDRASHWYNASHQGKRLEGDNVEIEAARAWLESQPTAMGESCSACGKRGKIFGEVLDGKDERIKHPLCGKCCQMWADVDTKDDVWSAICVRRNSGAYVVISPPPEVKP